MAENKKANNTLGNKKNTDNEICTYKNFFSSVSFSSYFFFSFAYYLLRFPIEIVFAFV